MSQSKNTEKTPFETWQEYAHEASEAAFEATKRAIDQSLAAREQAERIAATAIERTQALNAHTQETLLASVEAASAQARTGFERLGRICAVPVR